MFIEIPATKYSLLSKKLVHNMGVNDANYIVRPKINGKTKACPYYSKWASMIERCYSKKFLERHLTYKDCTVCIDWLLFSNFKAWMQTQKWENKELDKDILFQGNKVYSPHTCIFVDKDINVFLANNSATRGANPQGVIFEKSSGKFRARCRVNKNHKHLGLYETPELAFEAYKKFKYAIIKEVALKQADPLRTALLNYKII